MPLLPGKNIPIQPAAPHTRGDVSQGLGDPIPKERVAGPVFPYRGQEVHGVDPVTNPWHEEPDEYEDHSQPFPLDVEPEIVPVPVRIIKEDNRELRGFVTSQMSVDNQQRLIIGRNPRRSRVYIRNLSATRTVYIGPESTVMPTSGFPILPLTAQTLDDNEMEVWAISDDGSMVMVAILQERTIDPA